MSSKSAVATATMRPVVSLASRPAAGHHWHAGGQDILPTVGTCHKCQAMINSDFKRGA